MISPDTIDYWLRILSWCLVGFAGLWAVTATITYFHRRAYNLTHAESGGSKNITPDFLKVDKAKRDAAIKRGEAYETTLTTREAPTPVEQISQWSRSLANLTLLLGLVTTAFTTVTRIRSFQAGAEEIGSFERLSQIVSENKFGTIVAVVLIGIAVYEFSKKWKQQQKRA